MPNKSKSIPLRDLPLQAERLAADPVLLKAFNAAVSSDTFRKMALTKPLALLEEFGVQVPRGLSVVFFEGHFPSQPYPFGDGWFPTITLTNCRTFWVRTCKAPTKKGGRPICTMSREEVCFGFEIIPGRWLPPDAP